MSEETKKPRSHHPERITLTPQALNRVDTWMEQVEPQLKGNSFSRSDLVSWLVTSYAEVWSAADIASLTNAFFDPFKAAAWAMRQLDEMQKSGAAVDVKAFMEAALSTKPPREKTSRATKNKISSEKVGKIYDAVES